MIEELISETLNKAIEENVSLTPYNYYKLFIEVAMQKGIDHNSLKNYLYDEYTKQDELLDPIKEKINLIIENLKKEMSEISNNISETIAAQENVNLEDSSNAYEELEKLKKINLSLRINLEKAMRNIEQERQSLEKIKVKVYRDGLTGLYLREYLQIKLKENLYFMQRYGRIFSLQMIDVDDFKDINDKFGHQIGDNVLCQIGNLIKKNIRTSDIPIRYGGDEFVVLMPETDINSAKKVAEKFVQKMSKVVFRKKDEEFKVTFSIGLTSVRKDDTFESIMERVDAALYSSKRSGKNSITVFD
ncbi:GGDEF domain-containing protein [Desulfurella multipotens]|uniref:diguanylate cyclase n=1 Tax=Desulfurella multipotens TaxID=79269 RepID=A0A1G6HL95_9BACT|nr:GGDEF domain-containing protein [Desulfurella multipotens]PMP68413.1 MAG: GGDEF domain-containing protein [Desulfurella multipotens]SDB94991.1 diguanylate cyclase [Desulfurella multipotens]